MSKFLQAAMAFALPVIAAGIGVAAVTAYVTKPHAPTHVSKPVVSSTPTSMPYCKIYNCQDANPTEFMPISKGVKP